MTDAAADAPLDEPGRDRRRRGDRRRPDGADDTRHHRELTFQERYIPSDPTRVGTEPDYRFTLANERTFLAWVRTALALSAGGLGAVHLLPDDFEGSLALGLGLLVLSFVTAASAFRRWALNERAMRLNQPLPVSRLPRMMAIGTALVAIVAAALIVIDS